MTVLDDTTHHTERDETEQHETETGGGPGTVAVAEGGAGPVCQGGALPDACATVDVPHPRPDGTDRYTIGEVAAVTGLSADTLRWYERIGLLPHVDRSHTGQRRFSNRDLDWLSLVGKLRLTGMPVADMVRYAELVRQGEHTYPERLRLLRTTRESVLRRVAELRDTLAVLDYKIDIYAHAAPASERQR
ncbi:MULTISPECIES: MerR family transcriptional regulator [Streptomyces]|uniref:MerR family transcriptional regulator n=1 Tax=Streptomyces TaxID=1883 RepID=UPI0022487EC7|nr:MerR family transcriptional regulator [Streptomyces sp. JHD 1]MCX2971249.1 MerR family transcriptional regulator [Streptomyces sp. JHD 1]